MSSLPTNYCEPVDSGLRTFGSSSSSSSSNYNINCTSNEATAQSSVIPVKENKIYPCNQCSKSFSRPSALETHNYVHTGEKPFQCLSYNCGRRFSVVSNLRRHFKVHQKGVNNVNKISPQERLHCVRKLIKKKFRNPNATDQALPNFYSSSVNTTLDCKFIDPQELTSTLCNPTLPPMMVEEDTTQHILDSQMVTEQEVNLVIQKPNVSCVTLCNVNQRQNIDQLIGNQSTMDMYQQLDLNTPFAQFDDFNFL